MEYKGNYKTFNNSSVRTYSVQGRKNKRSLKEFIDCEELAKKEIIFSDERLEQLGKAITDAHKNKLPVIILTGAHPVKNGLTPIFLDWMKRKIITCIGTNGAGIIHDLEFAMLGESSEDVRDVLVKGEFGMAFETCMYINESLIEGNKRKLGFGESLGRLYCDDEFRKTVLDAALSKADDPGAYLAPYNGFKYADTSIVATAYKYSIPFTVHASIGTDIIDQHVNFDGEAKGGTSARDFLIFTEEISKLTRGGVVLNIGSAITGPEVLLKAVSMATNAGKKPDKIICADFDMRPFASDDENSDESKYHYFFRDQKSVVTRIPDAFRGKGYYFEGDHSKIFVALYQYFRKHTEE